MTNNGAPSQGQPASNSILSAYESGREAFFDFLVMGEHEDCDDAIATWYEKEIRCQANDLQMRKLSMHWCVGFIAGYTSTYLEFTYMGMHQNIIDDNEADYSLLEKIEPLRDYNRAS